MRIGIYGGTFNPVHWGHVRLASEYAASLELDRLLVIPASVPPHKPAPGLIGGALRLEMCRLAFQKLENCVVSGLELQRPGKSYTVDTLEQLRREYPDDTLYLLMGSDMFYSVTQWKNWRRIIDLAVLCVGARETDEGPLLAAEKKRLERLGASCRMVRLEPMVLSSTEVRRRAAAGESLEGLVPEPVADYIAQNGLYREKD